MRLLCFAALFSVAACAGDLPRKGTDDGSTTRFDRGLVVMVDAAPPDGAKPPPDGFTSDRGITPTPDKSITPTPDKGVTPTPDKGTIKLDGWTGTDDIGKPCSGNSQCQYGLCAQNTHTGVWFCTKQCDRCAATPCPTGSGCQNAGPFYICAPGYPNAPCN